MNVFWFFGGMILGFIAVQVAILYWGEDFLAAWNNWIIRRNQKRYEKHDNQNR